MISHSEKRYNYQELVLKRKKSRKCDAFGFKNQSDFPDFDTNEIGNFSTWANDLDADIVIVGQDYCNTEIFKRDHGKIQLGPLDDPEILKQWDTATNFYLWKLLKSIGRDIGVPKDGKTKKNGIFLTNVVVDLKDGVMNASIPQKVYNYSGEDYLRPLVKIINPRMVIALGTGASRSLLNLYKDDHAENKFYKSKPFGDIFNHGYFSTGNGKMRLFPVYHPGPLGQANRKNREKDKSLTGFERMITDWADLLNFL